MIQSVSTSSIKAYTKQQVFTFVALFVLLAARFPIGDFVSNFLQLFHAHSIPDWLGSIKLLQDWLHFFWDNYSFLLAGIVIILNRNDLNSLKIDNNFLVIFSSSVIPFVVYYDQPSRWVAVPISMFLLYYLFKKELRTEKQKPNLWQVMIIILIGILFVLIIISRTKLSQAFHTDIVELPFVVLEELVFRGLLWMFLKSLGRLEYQIVILQAILFWFSHAYYMFTYPLFFWIFVPIASIVLGIVVWKYKSITPSTITHLLFNLYWMLI